MVPSIILSSLTSPGSSLPLTGTLIYTFGALITALQVLGALTEGHVLSVPFNSGSYLASALYIWLGTGGGRLSFAASGYQFVLSFQPLLFLLILPSLFSAIRTPLTYLLEQSEAGQAASDSA